MVLGQSLDKVTSQMINHLEMIAMILAKITLKHANMPLESHENTLTLTSFLINMHTVYPKSYLEVTFSFCTIGGLTHT